MLVGLSHPSSGRVLFGGEPIDKQIIDFKMRPGQVPGEAFLAL
jgi:hypothetical protein